MRSTLGGFAEAADVLESLDAKQGAHSNMVSCPMRTFRLMRDAPFDLSLGCSFFLLVRANAQRTLFCSFFGVVTRCVVNLEKVNRMIRVIPFFRAKVECFQSHFPLGARCIRANGKPAASDLDDRSCQQDQLPVCANLVPVRCRGTVLSGPVFESTPVLKLLQLCLSCVGDQAESVVARFSWCCCLVHNATELTSS